MCTSKYIFIWANPYACQIRNEVKCWRVMHFCWNCVNRHVLQNKQYDLQQGNEKANSLFWVALMGES